MASIASSFTYSITRPYPYPHFKWVVIIGGLLATILFTVINLAATGYVLRVEYTSNWNKTMEERRWFQRQPILLVANTQTSCQSLDVQIESQFFTNKRNLRYTLDHVWQYEKSGSDIVPLPSLSYTNNAIENCMVDAIRLQLESTSRTAEQVGWTGWGIFATASIHCSVNNSQTPVGVNEALGPTWFNLTVQYELVGPAGTMDPQLGSSANLTESENPITWWGRSLMEWYWLAVVYTMGENEDIELDNATGVYNKGFITIPPQGGPVGIAKPNFFGDQVSWKFMYEQDGVVGMPIGSASIPQNEPHTIENLISTEVSPNIWRHVDNFARSFYSVILADLGQQSSQNILMNAAALHYFSQNFSSMTDVETYWLKAGPSRSTFNGSEPFTVDASYIYTDYLCQVPRLKSTGALIIAILVADLVFLQVAWKLLTWVATAMVERRDPQAHFATGCLVCGGVYDSMTLRELDRTSNSAEAPSDWLGSPKTAVIGKSRFWRSGSRALPKVLSSESKTPILDYTEDAGRPKWHDRTISSEAVTTSVDPGTQGKYQRL